MQYAPEPPFNSGTPETAPPPVLKAGRDSLRRVLKEREHIIRQIAAGKCASPSKTLAGAKSTLWKNLISANPPRACSQRCPNSQFRT